MSHATSILLLGGSRSQALRLQRSLARHFLLVEVASDIDQARALLQRCNFHRLLIVDPQLTWDELLQALDTCDSLPAGIVLVTDREHLELAVDALRGGISDVVLRPFKTNDLVQALREAPRRAGPGVGTGAATPRHRLVGDAAAIAEIRALLARIATTSSPVLLEGEQGTGKELIARLLHERSGRAGPFVAINCAAFEPDELARALFGPAREADAGARQAGWGLLVGASGGTLLLAGIEAMRADIGARLLHAIDNQVIPIAGSERDITIDCRVVASTRPGLLPRSGERQCDEGLYRRLHALRVVVPPLRERKADIRRLATHFMRRMARDLAIEPVALDDSDFATLECHDWPGNVRELQDAIARTLLLGALPADLAGGLAPGSAAQHYPLDWTLEQVKQRHMQRVVAAAGGNKSAAARRLGISCRTLERRLGTTRRHPRR